MTLLVCPGFPRDYRIILLESVAVIDLEVPHSDHFILGEGSLWHRTTVTTSQRVLLERSP